MKNINTFSKIFLFIAIFSGSLWFGSYLSKMLIYYQLFEPEMILKNYIKNENQEGIIITIVPAIAINIVMYYSMLISFLVFILFSKLNLRKNGWLFITTLIIIITAPFEIYLSIIDIKILLEVNNGIFSASEIIKNISDRIILLSGFPIIILLSFMAIIYFITFKPFQMKETHNET